MASRTEIGVVYGAAVVQGLALVTFPAASAVFTSPDGFGFDSTRYGTMFVPQVAFAIFAAALAPKLARRWSLRRVLLAGFAGDIISMSLLALSRLLLGAPDGAFALLLVATAALGFGFGATVMALNTYAEAFFPERTDGAVLALNALLGLGTALAPVFVAIVVALGAWWLLPVVVACIMALLFGVASTQPLRVSADADDASTPIGWSALPQRFWLYAAAVFLYGMLETLNGNWSMLYLSSERGVSSGDASLALTAFWGMVTVGRVLFAMIQRWFPPQRTYHVLPFLLAITFVIIAALPSGVPAAGILSFALAGFGCSALLPLTISFASEQLVTMGAVAGAVIAFYQLGYGIAAFGTGPLVDHGVGLPTLFGFAAIAAVIMGGLSFMLARKGAAKTAVPAATS